MKILNKKKSNNYKNKLFISILLLDRKNAITINFNSIYLKIIYIYKMVYLINNNQ